MISNTCAIEMAVELPTSELGAALRTNMLRQLVKHIDMDYGNIEFSFSTVFYNHQSQRMSARFTGICLEPCLRSWNMARVRLTAIINTSRGT